MQIGHFRIGSIHEHLSVAHSTHGRQLQWFAPNGNHANLDYVDYTSTQFSTWGQPDTLEGVSFGENFVQIGDYRLGDVDGTHFSIAHKSGVTNWIFKNDASGDYPGPRKDDLTTFGREILDCVPMDDS